MMEVPLGESLGLGFRSYFSPLKTHVLEEKAYCFSYKINELG
jgi:hypothetical protein